MPVEIKELHISIAVNASTVQKPSSSQSVATGGYGKGKDALIEECVEQVLKVLQNKQER